MMRNGLTLVEVLAVVVILSILAVTLVVGLGGRIGTAQHHIAATQIAKLVGAVETYQGIRGKLPDQGSFRTVLAEAGKAWSVEGAILDDPWGNPYEYLVPGPEGRGFEIISYGSDGAPGGEDDQADISSARLK